MQIVCAWCGRVLGTKQGGEGITHGICPECLAKLQAEIVTLRRHLIGAERVMEKILKIGIELEKNEIMWLEKACITRIQFHAGEKSLGSVRQSNQAGF